MTSTFAIAIYRDRQGSLTLDELARAAGVHPGAVERCVEFGLLEPVETVGSCCYFETAAVPRLRAIFRLRHDLGANLASTGLILDLVERVDRLEREVERLRLER